MAEISISKYIRESNLIEGIDDPAEDAQSIAVWRDFKLVEKITREEICELQGGITKLNDMPEAYKGVLRSTVEVNVRVGAHVAPPWQEVSDLIDEWIATFFDKDPLEAHVDFEHIHPFVDGNGRTGRMLYWWHCLRKGETPTLFTAEDRQAYYQLFRSFEDSEWFKFVQYMQGDPGGWTDGK